MTHPKQPTGPTVLTCLCIERETPACSAGGDCWHFGGDMNCGICGEPHAPRSADSAGAFAAFAPDFDGPPPDWFSELVANLGCGCTIYDVLQATKRPPAGVTELLRAVADARQAMELNHRWHNTHGEDYDQSSLQELNLTTIAKLDAALSATRPDKEATK